MGTTLDADRFLERPVAIGQLLTNVVATTAGSWAEVHGARPLNVTVEGSGAIVATCEVRGSCSPARPDDSTHGVLLTSMVINGTDGGSSIVDAAFMWIKVRVTAYTSGTINAYTFNG